MKNPRFEGNDDIFEMAAPELEKLSCKDCVLRAKDVKFGDVVTPGAVLDKCDAFDSKPTEVILKYEECPYYIGEKEDADK